MKKHYLGFLVTALLILVMAMPALAERKTRDLVFEEEDDEETGVSTQSQIAPQGEPFVALYELKHK